MLQRDHDVTDQSNAIDIADVLEKLDHLQSLLLQCRSIFPTLAQELIGQRAFMTAPYYLSRGYEAQIQLKEPISAEFIERNKQLGQWINENTLIRLYGILNYHGLFRKIDQDLPGGREMDLLRRMRNAFTKTPLNYRPNDKENMRLRKEVIRCFGLKEQNFPEEQIPTPIDTVVEPIFKACREYIAAYTAAHNKRIEAMP
jgi:hypothetical protein